MMALKKLNTGIKKREGGGLKKLDPNAMRNRMEAAKALDFVEPARDDLLEGIDEDESLNPEQKHQERMARLDVALDTAPKPKVETNSSTMKSDLKRQGDAFKNQAATDYFACIVFADGDAVTEFLKKAGYPNADATFVDGYLLAERLGIKDLPRPKFQLQKIRPPQKTLSRLVTAFPEK